MVSTGTGATGCSSQSGFPLLFHRSEATAAQGHGLVHHSISLLTLFCIPVGYHFTVSLIYTALSRRENVSRPGGFRVTPEMWCLVRKCSRLSACYTNPPQADVSGQPLQVPKDVPLTDTGRSQQVPRQCHRLLRHASQQAEPSFPPHEAGHRF